MKGFAKWTAKAVGVFAFVAVLGKAMAIFEHKMLDGIEPRRK